jgi:ACR3 family arsenite transporter
VARIALPLVAYLAVMWTGALWLARRVGLGYRRATTVAFTAAGNNFELAIAVAISVFGVTSGQALAGVVGLVYVALWARRRYFPIEEVAS